MTETTQATEAADGQSQLTEVLGTGATADECIELAEALERRRALTIVATVKALGVGGADAAMPTAFHAGYQLACDEIAHRIEHEQWELVVPNVPANRLDAAGGQSSERSERG